MAEARQSEIAYEAACRIISPKELRVMVSLLCALVIVVLYLIKQNDTNKAWIDVHRKQLAKLEAQVSMGQRFDQQDALLTAIATAVGAQAEPLGKAEHRWV